jgi:hypothetical protein
VPRRLLAISLRTQMMTAAECRERAEHCRRIAASVVDPNIPNDLLKTADGWIRLAESIERDYDLHLILAEARAEYHAGGARDTGPIPVSAAHSAKQQHALALRERLRGVGQNRRFGNRPTHVFGGSARLPSR